jgi:uncharacterized membrane protein YfcA
MHIYLPIADISVNILLLLGLGAAVGFLSGLFGVGGGFLLTPLLFLIGVPPAVAVGTQANQIAASSVSGMLAHWRRKTLDFKMGSVLLAGGLTGSAGGIFLFSYLRRIGQIDLVVQLAYVVLLGTVGALMLQESVRAILRRKKSSSPKLHHHTWIHGLPFKMRFRQSRLYISVLPVIGIGFLVGVLTAIMGVGGGFLMVPAMIYLIGMPTKTVVGTSLFQITFVAFFVTLMQAINNQTVDLFLALTLIPGGVIGAQFGSRFGGRLRAEELRALLALLVLGVCAKVAVDLIVRPDDLYSLSLVVAK